MESKKVKLTAVQLEEVFNVIQELDNPKMAYTSSYWIGKNMKNIREEMRVIAEIKQKLIQDHALMVDGKTVSGDTPGSIKLDPTKVEAYWKNLRELNNQEIELSIWPISINLLQDRDGKPLEVKPSVFMTLDFMFIDDESFVVSCKSYLESIGYTVEKKPKN